MRRNKRIVSLIGYHCTLIKKADGSRLDGLIIGETANTLLVQTQKGPKRIPKKGHIFEIVVEGEKMIADGDELVGRPAQNLKRIRHNWLKRPLRRLQA
ncbi:MAG: ribonuclease P protein subunit [Nitrososphaerota archaeon]